MSMNEIAGVDLDAMWRKLLAFHHRLRGFKVFALLDNDGDFVPLAPVKRWQAFGVRPRQGLCIVGLGQNRAVSRIGGGLSASPAASQAASAASWSSEASKFGLNPNR